MASPVTGIPNLSAFYGPGGQPYSMQPVDPMTQLMQALQPIIAGAGAAGTANLGMNTARQAAGMADPFSGERGAYQGQLRDYMGANAVNPAQVTAGTNTALQQLMSFMQNPSQISQNPAYKAGLGFGTEAVNRGMGASGLLNSGNRALGLEKFGEDYGMNFQNQIFNQLLGGVGANINAANLGLGAQGQGYGQLAQLAGANTGNPAYAGGLLNQGRQTQTGQIGQGFAGLTAIPSAFSAAQRLLGTPGSGGFNIPASATTMGPPGDMFGGGDFADNWDLMGNLGGDYGGASNMFTGLMDAFG